ncbi:MAG: hypothetical protein M0Q42_09170 [Xanthomonadales bacterium]|nr:hypothetical protein [Xanthomonadales bacterium]
MTQTRNPGRRLLIIVAIAFLTPFIAALVLNRIGWHPDATRNHGELVEPPVSLAELVLHDGDGQALPLANLERRFTWLLRLPDTCAEDCLQRLDEIHRVRYSLGRHAPKLAVRLIGAAPLPELPDSLRALAADSGQALTAAWSGFGQARPWSSWLVDDKGYVMLHFPPTLEARLIRRDLGRLVK